MKLRATVSFSDGVPDAVQEWPDTIECFEAARRWQNAVAACHPGVSTVMDLEQLCDDHGRWESFTECAECGKATCSYREDHDCLDCAGNRDARDLFPYDVPRFGPI